MDNDTNKPETLSQSSILIENIDDISRSITDNENSADSSSYVSASSSSSSADSREITGSSSSSGDTIYVEDRLAPAPMREEPFHPEVGAFPAFDPDDEQIYRNRRQNSSPPLPIAVPVEEEPSPPIPTAQAIPQNFWQRLVNRINPNIKSVNARWVDTLESNNQIQDNSRNLS